MEKHFHKPHLNEELAALADATGNKRGVTAYEKLL
jgi:hypothetical protein